MILPIKVQPFAHQQDAFEKAIHTFQARGLRGGYALLMEMGTGKTATAIGIAGRLYLDGLVKRVLIVTPASVCGVWPEELSKYADYPCYCTILDGAREKRAKCLRKLEYGFGSINSFCGGPRVAPLLVAVINYEAAWRMEQELMAFRPDMIIADESQRIKSPTAHQSKAMHRLGDTARFRLILSGTPLQNSPMDFWSQYRFLDPSIFGPSFYPFKAKYCVMGGFRVNGKAVQITGYRHLDELTAKVHSIASRVTKEEALDLPPFTIVNREVTLSPAETSAYKAMAQQSIVELESGCSVTAPIIITKLMRLQQITGGFLSPDPVTGEAQRTEQIGTSKLDSLREILEDYVLTEGRKLIIFARFVPEVLAIESLCSKLKIDHVILYGKIKKEHRAALVKSFQTEEDCKVFIAQIETAGLGITLNAASTAVLYSVDFNFASYEQALSRIHRQGQRNACTYIHLMVPGSIDERVLEALSKKEDLAVRVVDGWKNIFALNERKENLHVG